jgi:hypothetical protein
MVVVPGTMAVTIPVTEPTVAMDVLLLVHVPPVVALVNVEAVPAHRFITPVIAVGSAYTVTMAVAAHPVGSV